jgi:thioredoxin 1
MAIQETSDAGFEADVLQSSVPVVVDFFADWCGPCRMLTPVLQEIGTEMGETIKVIKLNIDTSPKTPAQFGVRSIPTLVLFQKGQAISTKVGLVPKNKIIEWVNNALGEA